MTILKIAYRYINSDHITQVVLEGGSAAITLLAVTGDLETAVTVAQEITLRGRDAIALKWWLDCHSSDLLAAYSNALFSAREGVEG
jgi:hypothetical protein